MSARTIAPNIVQTTRPDGSIHGFRVYVRHPDPVTGKSRKVGKRFPPETALEDLVAFRDAAAEAEREPEPDPDGAESFRAAAARYLAHPQVKAMPAYATRLNEISKWVERFGDLPRRDVDTSRIDAALQTWVTAGYAPASANKFRTALMSLWTRLDGRGAANPVKDAMMFEEAQGSVRGQSYDLLTQILDGIPDERGTAVDRATLYLEVWTEPATVVARRYDVSSTYLARLCRRLTVPTPPVGYWQKPAAARPPQPALPRGGGEGLSVDLLKGRARLEVLAYTGMEPGQLGRMDPERDLDLVAGWYTPPFRRKGLRRRRTSRAVVRLPLTPESAAAFARLTAVDGWGPFQTASLDKVWQRACRRLERRMQAANPRARVPHIRLKDLRHSFGTRVFEDTGDETTVARMLQHAPGSPMTMRYTLGAVPTVLQTQMAKFSGGRKSGHETPGRARVVPLRYQDGTRNAKSLGK